MEDMNNKENARMIIALRERGWTDTEINDLILYMDTGAIEWKDKVVNGATSPLKKKKAD